MKRLSSSLFHSKDGVNAALVTLFLADILKTYSTEIVMKKAKNCWLWVYEKTWASKVALFLVS